MPSIIKFVTLLSTLLQRYGAQGLLLSVLVGMTWSVPANAIIKHRATALINAQAQAFSRDSGVDFRYAQLGYWARTNDLTMDIDLNLNELDRSSSLTTSRAIRNANLEYRFGQAFSMMLGLQDIPIGMAATRPDGQQISLDRGVFEQLTLGQANGLVLDWQVGKRQWLHLGVFDQVERSDQVSTTLQTNVMETPLVSSRFRYQFEQALQIDFAVAKQFYSGNNDGSLFVNAGFWAYFSPFFRWEAELLWADKIKGLNQSQAGVTYSINYLYDRDFEFVSRYQIMRDDQVNEYTVTDLGLKYKLSHVSHVAFYSRSVEQAQNYAGLYQPSSGVFLQVQFKD